MLQRGVEKKPQSTGNKNSNLKVRILMCFFNSRIYHETVFLKPFLRRGIVYTMYCHRIFHVRELRNLVLKFEVLFSVAMPLPKRPNFLCCPIKVFFRLHLMWFLMLEWRATISIPVCTFIFKKIHNYIICESAVNKHGMNETVFSETCSRSSFRTERIEFSEMK